MSTAITTHQHRFAHPIAMAAVATVVVVGGATAVGVAVSHDGGTTAPTRSGTSTYDYQGCNDLRCAPPSHGRHGNAPADRFQPPAKGGTTMIGQP